MLHLLTEITIFDQCCPFFTSVGSRVEITVLGELVVQALDDQRPKLEGVNSVSFSALIQWVQLTDYSETS